MDNASIEYEKFKNKFFYTYNITNYINNSTTNMIIENKFYNFITNDLKLMYENHIIDEYKLIVCFIYFKRFIHFGLIKNSFVNIVVALNLGFKYWEDQCRDLVYYLNNIIYYEMIILKSNVSLHISPSLYIQTCNFIKE